MDPVTTPVESVDVRGPRRAATTDALLVDAWAAYHEELYAFLVRTTRDPDVAEDLLQEAFVRLTRELGSGPGPENLRAWLYRVATNLAISRGRRIATAVRGLVRLGARSDTGRTIDGPESVYLRHETQATLMRALDTLAPDARAALLLASQGFTGAEIAATIGRSDIATRTLLCRARLRLRERLGSEEALS